MYTYSSVPRAHKLQHTYCIWKHTHTHKRTQTHIEHILFCSPSSLSAKQLQTQNTLFPSYSLACSFPLALFPLSFVRHLIASPPVSLCPPPLLPFFLSPACQLSSNVKQRSTPTLSAFFYCLVEWREREGESGIDNKGRARGNEREEEHKYRQQALITWMSFDSRHTPYDIHIRRIDR